MSRPGVSFYQFLPGISDAILPRDHRIYYLFSQFSCTASGQVQLDLVLDAVQQRWVEAVVAQVRRLHSRGGKAGSHDRDRLRAEATLGDEQLRNLGRGQSFAECSDATQVGVHAMRDIAVYI